jgi:hypothetical protein
MLSDPRPKITPTDKLFIFSKVHNMKLVLPYIRVSLTNIAVLIFLLGKINYPEQNIITFFRRHKLLIKQNLSLHFNNQ